MKYQAANPVRVSNCVGNRNGAALRHANQRKPIQSDRVNHCFEVLDKCLKRNVIDIPVGKAISPLVKAYQSSVSREFLQKVPPNRAFPLAIQVGYHR